MTTTPKAKLNGSPLNKADAVNNHHRSEEAFLSGKTFIVPHPPANTGNDSAYEAQRMYAGIDMRELDPIIQADIQNEIHARRVSAYLVGKNGHSPTLAFTSSKGDWLPVQELVKVRPLGRTKIFELIRTGQIKVARIVKPGNIKGKTLVSIRSLDEFIARHEVKAA
jgi:hypothetical protein